MSAKTITMTEADLARVIAQAVKAAVKATPNKPKADPIALSPALSKAVQNDPKTDGKYRCFATIIARKGIRKYGASAKFDPKTVAALQKAYGIQ